MMRNCGFSKKGVFRIAVERFENFLHPIFCLKNKGITLGEVINPANFHRGKQAFAKKLVNLKRYCLSISYALPYTHTS